MPNKQRKKQPDLLTQPLTFKDAKKQAKVVRRLALAPELKTLSGQTRASREQSQNIKQWFPQYTESVEQAGGQSAAATQQALATMGQNTQGLTNYAETLRQRLGSEAAADQALRGAPSDTSGSTLNAEAQLARIASANTLAGVTATQGASNQTYFADKARIGKREKLQQLLNEGDVRRGIADDRLAIQRQGRDIVRDEVARLRDTERDYRLGLAASRLNKRGQAIDARQTAASQAETRRHNLTAEQISAQNAATSAASQSDLARQRRYDRRHPNAGESPADKPNALDQADVQRAGVLLRSLKERSWELPQQQILDAIMAQDQTISRKEALKAYKRVLKRRLAEERGAASSAGAAFGSAAFGG